MTRALAAAEGTTKPHVADSGPASSMMIGWRYTEAKQPPDLMGLAVQGSEWRP